MLLTLFLCATSASANGPVPSTPLYNLLDEPGALAPASVEALQSILTEHEKISGEQLFVAILNHTGEGEGADIEATADRIYEGWRIGRQSKGKGALLLIDWTSRQGKLRVGYGLEPLLPAVRATEIIDDFVLPELSDRNPGRAIALGALEVLRSVGSPLIQSGKAEEILKQAGMLNAIVLSMEAPSLRMGGAGSVVLTLLLIAGFVLLLFILTRILAAEVHYTAEGWFRPSTLGALKFSLSAKQRKRLPLGGADGSW